MQTNNIIKLNGRTVGGSSLFEDSQLLDALKKYFSRQDFTLECCDFYPTPKEGAFCFVYTKQPKMPCLSNFHITDFINGEWDHKIIVDHRLIKPPLDYFDFWVDVSLLDEALNDMEKC